MTSQPYCTAPGCHSSHTAGYSTGNATNGVVGGLRSVWVDPSAVFGTRLCRIHAKQSFGLGFG